jgi:hypothetical protein
MKLKNLIAMSMASLAMFSCTKDSEEVIETGETRTVSFNVSFDSSRLGAKGDDTSCLFYCTGESIKKTDVVGNSITISENVIIDKTYFFTFWLSGGGSNNNFKFDGTYTTDLENEDSFYASETINVSKSTNINVKLERPYAKIKVLSKDVNQVADSSKIEIEGLGTKFNILDGTVVKNEEKYPLYIEKDYAPNSGIIAEAFGFIDSSIQSATVKVTVNGKVFVKTVKVLPNTTTEITIDDFSSTDPTFNITFSKDWNSPITGEDIEVKADIEISNLEELKNFRDEVNNGETFRGKIVKLTNNIDLANEEWTPIGKNRYNSFKGTFDGQNYIIKNLTSIKNQKEHIGFFWMY